MLLFVSEVGRNLTPQAVVPVQHFDVLDSCSITLRNISAFCNAGHLREEAVCLLQYHVMAVMLSE